MNKILFVIGSLDIGGAEMHLFQLLPRLKKRGWDVELFCLSRPGILAHELTSIGVTVHSPPIVSKVDSSLFYSMFRMSASFLKLFVLLLKNRSKIAHFYLPEAYLIGGLCSVLSGTKFKVMSRRSLNFYQHSHPILFKLEKKMHSRMDGILGNSKAVLSQLAEEGVVQSKLHLIYNGVDLARFANTKSRIAIRDSLSIPDSALVFVIVANLLPYKGHSVLLQALAKASSQIAQPWYLLILGRDDGIGNDLKKQAEEYNISDSIKWLGSRSDVPDLLASSDVGILSSLEEGFSNAILECMAAGLPMIVTDVGGNKEAVLDGVNGLVVPANEPSLLAEAIVHLANNAEKRKQFASASIERISSEFSMDICVSKYDLFYKNLILN